ncbi:MAG: hypothetical protein PWP30_2170 [Eubacteriaceae bacterium]|nr:hypothetical protein [Eubacteriaceae bacterium]
MDPFEYIRENVNIIELSQYYGMEIDRHNKTLCPWHSDTHASLSFKFNRCKCFACNASASNIDLVCQLFGLEPLQAVSKINTDFGLGLDLQEDYKPDMTEIQKRQHARDLEKAFDSWVDRTYSEYAQIARKYWSDIMKYRPAMEEDFKPEYVEAIHKWEVINYKLDLLLNGSTKEKMALFREKTDRERGEAS